MSLLGPKLRELRTTSELSVRQFAQLIGKSAGYVSRLEARGEIPSSELICVIAEKLGVDAEELFQLAKDDQLNRVEREIESKQEAALSLHRKEKDEA